MRRKGKATGLHTALDSLVRRLDRNGRGAYQAARVSHAWGKVSNGVVKAHATGVQLREGVFLVYVDGSSWAALLNASSEQYRQALNTELGEELVSKVRFTVPSGQHARYVQPVQDEPEEAAVEDNKTPAMRLSAVEMAQVEASVSRIPDEGLREAVLRATVRDLEGKRAARPDGTPPDSEMAPQKD